ncbi:MAG: thioredoxin family protein [Geothrix sp.]|uniref:thioredoxin family protein n=1 Tax=Geothrix sp. TaxID=1962974 RepID=UPI0017D5A4D6|nr:thioredoxin family protein [Geothrix sp.]NWJ41387.1 thioredoxin family protein [Geothrix sp.]WIL20626.1 MAG: thioredoxin family protein [Geothrix sp.]
MIRAAAPFLVAAALVAQAPNLNPGLKLGEACPPFSLPGTDGKAHGPASPLPLMVVFLSTECPYVMATQARINAYAKQYEGRVTVLAINANDVDTHAKESLADMTAQAKGQGFVFPYLKDAPQAVTRTFGAACTPDFFLFDRTRKLVYRGRMDDSWRDATQVKVRDLDAATEAVLAGRPVSTEQPPSRGCSIKWK